MPKVYRVMKEGDGKPAIGSSSSCLGIRASIDIFVDDQNHVHPDQGGMSVSPSLATIPERLLPRRFRTQGFPQAAGNNTGFVWSLGEGGFLSEPIASFLKLRPDPKAPERHGFIEPDRVMLLDQYKGALHATQDQWRWEEEK